MLTASSAAKQPRGKGGLWVSGGGSGGGSSRGGSAISGPRDHAKETFKAAEAGDIDASDLEAILYTKVPSTRIPDSDEAFEMNAISELFGTDTETFTDVTMRMFDHGYWGTSEHKGKEYLTIIP